MRVTAGEELGVADANAILRRTRAQVVVLAGAIESGKTTLLSTVYELFQHGMVGPLSFGGSYSLLAFERICHAGRVLSERTTAKTDRTTQDQDPFLHLRVHGEGVTARDLLLVDLPGEQFRLARDFGDESAKMAVMHRADSVAFLVSAAELLKPATRHKECTDVRSLIRAFTEAGVLGLHSAVQLVVSKVDLLYGGDTGDAVAYVADFVSQLRKEFGEQLGSLAQFEVAARPAAPVVPYGYNVPALLDAWITTSHMLGTSPNLWNMPKPGTVTSEFDMLARRGL